MPRSASAHFSFILVICGPVGAIAALLLASSGRRVLVIEAATAVYPLPRAVHIDAHSARILASILPASTVTALLTPMQHCMFTDASGRQLLRFDCGEHRLHGLHSDFIIDQPEVERALRSRFAAHPNITFIQGDSVIAVLESLEGERRRVRVTTAADRRFSG